MNRPALAALMATVALVVTTDGSLWGVDVDGLAWRSTDGQAWTKHKKLPTVEAIAALDHTTAYALNPSSLLILTA